MTSDSEHPHVLADSVDIAYLTKYAGKLDSGIAFTDFFYLQALSRSPLSTLVFANALPKEFRADGLSYTTQLYDYRLHDPVLHLVNGMGSSYELLRAGFFPEHKPGLKISFIHDEPAAYDYYNTDIWNREYVRDELMSLYDGFIFVSSVCRTQWLEYAGYDEATCFYLPNTCAEESLIQASLDDWSRDDIREELGMRDDALHLAVVATVQPRKAQLYAVQALERLRRRHPGLHVHLHLVGRITQRHYGDEIRDYVERHGLEDEVTIVGEVQKVDALKYIYATDVLVLTSESEAMPLVLLEAMQLGTPIVTTDVGGIPEVVDDDTAELFEVRNADDLADKLARVLEDEPRRAALRQNAEKRYWDDFSNARFFERFGAILHGLVGDRLPTPALEADGADRVARASGLTVRVSESPDDAARRALRVTGTPTDSRAELRALLAGLEHAHGVDRARVELDEGYGLSDALSLAKPFARLSLEPVSLAFPERAMELEREGLSDRPRVGREEIFHLTDAADYEAALGTRARAKSVNPNVVKELARIKRSYRWKISNGIAQPFLKNHLYRKARDATRKTKAFLRKRRAARVAEAETPAVAAIFNSPMQMMAMLSLWDERYHDTVPEGTPLVALIYSTNGSKDFIKLLTRLCEKTRRFEKVIDITPEYSGLYGGKLSFRRCVDFKKKLLEHLGRYSVDTIFIAAFMSARAQKMLYEVFSDSTIRLFEDGMGSYVPKRIKTIDRGIVDRVTSGDCAEAHHIRLIESVDLMLDSVPVPPQYRSDVPRIEFPELSVRSYRIDYQRFGDLLGVQRRRFATDEALLLTQNFSDHLKKEGFDAALEIEMNDSVIADLLERGQRVVIRPHPRASRRLWGARWERHPKVEVWDEVSSYPIEVLIDYTQPPRAIVGLSSSCLFYLRDFERLDVKRYPDARAQVLFDLANEEYKLMIDLARDALSPYELAGEGLEKPAAAEE